jgi:multiple sugar transport system substrate-binding protein
MRKRAGSKRIFAVIGAAVLIFAAMSPFIRASAAEKTIEISFWSIFPEGDPKKDSIEQLIAEFEALNSNIKVTHLGVNFWDYFGKIRTAQAGGTDPDVSFNDNCTVIIRAKSGVIRKLDSFMEKSGYDISEFRENNLNQYNYEGGIYALPFSSDFRLLYYNKDHFIQAGLDPDNPPQTIEELIEYAENLDVWDGSKLVRVGFHPKLGNNSFYTDVWNIGGRFFNDDGTPNFLDETVMAGMRQYVELCNRYTMRQFNGFMTLTQAKVLDPFIVQLASMEVNGDWLAWDIEYYKEKNPNDPQFDFNWGVAPYPYTDNNRSSYGAGFSLELSSRSTEEKAEAGFKLIQFLTSYETQLRWVDIFQFTPSNIRSLDELLSNPAIPENTRKIFEEAAYKRSPDVCEAVPEWWGYVLPELDLIITGKLSLEQAMQNVQNNLMDKINAYYDKSLTGPIDLPLLIGIICLIVVTGCIVIFVK